MATGATLAGAGALAAGGVTAPAVALSAPAVGTAAGITAGNAYDGIFIDEGFDSLVDNYAEPFIAGLVDNTIDVVEATAEFGDDIANSATDAFDATASFGGQVVDATVEKTEGIFSAAIDFGIRTSDKIRSML